MLLVGKHVGVIRQVGTARIDEIDARQGVLARDFLSAQVLFHRHREIGAALDRGVVADDHAFASRDPPDAGDHSRTGNRIAVHAVSGKLRQLEERTSRIEQRPHALARQQLAARDVSRPRSVAAALLDGADAFPQIRDERRHRVAIVRKRRIARGKLRFDDRHRFVRRRSASQAAAGRGCPGINVYGCTHCGSSRMR
jgi:hypothetical protein